jgi:hypothetical protein
MLRAQRKCMVLGIVLLLLLDMPPGYLLLSIMPLYMLLLLLLS